MTNKKLIQENELKKLIINQYSFIDVRSPNEFLKGSIRNAVNIPILSNDERHKVGVCFQRHGQDAAIELGNKIVSGTKKDKLVEKWSTFVRQKPNSIIYCARGGLRSEICQTWLNQNNIECSRVIGGYKTIRNFLLSELKKICMSQKLFLLSGTTGSGKTELLKNINRAVDLERIANHKGSSFGKPLNDQPAQIDIENEICINLIKLINENSLPILLEDESRNIGARHLPLELSQAMEKSQMVLVEVSFKERIDLLLREYVVERYKDTLKFYRNSPYADLEFSNHLISSLKRLEKRLGGDKTQKILKLLEAALKVQKRDNFQSHRKWLEEITTSYYDPLYEFKLEKRKDRICFRGNHKEVLDWLKDKQKIQVN